MLFFFGLTLTFQIADRLEETAEHWKLEQQALLKGQEMAEAAAQEAEKHYLEEQNRLERYEAGPSTAQSMIHAICGKRPVNLIAMQYSMIKRDGEI